MKLSKQGPLDQFVRDGFRCEQLSEWLVLGSQIVKAETIEELSSIDNHDLASWTYTFFPGSVDFKESKDIELLKRQLIVNIVGKNIRELYISEKSIRGPKGDRLKQFFDAITAEPQSVDFLCEKYGIARDTTAKNHRRFDVFPGRGITKIKNRKIFRQPVDG